MKQIIFDNISTDYFITEDGRCYNRKTNNWLKGQVGKNGYRTYWIVIPTLGKKRLYAHRLVAEQYISNPDGKKEINHIDGNKLNNCIDNLEWATPRENQQHALNLELRKFSHVYCFSPNKQLVAEYKTIEEAAQAVGVTRSIIAQELHKEVKALSGGFFWNDSKILGKTIIYKNNGKSKQVNQYDLKGKFIKQYSSTGEAARSIGGNCSHIGECCRGKIKTYKKFIWRYVEDIVSPSGESQRDTVEVS